MNLDELEAMCASQEAMGLEHLVLTMPAPQSWTKPGFDSWPEQVRSPFGLCRYTGGWDGESVVIWPSAKQVRNYIKKTKKAAIPKWGVAIIDDKKPEGEIIIRAMTEREAKKVGAAFASHVRFHSREETEEAIRWAYTSSIGAK